MGEGAPEKRRMQQTGQSNVVDETPLAAEQRPILDAQHPAANEASRRRESVIFHAYKFDKSAALRLGRESKMGTSDGPKRHAQGHIDS
jgi:hypothetical protein